MKLWENITGEDRKTDTAFYSLGYTCKGYQANCLWSDCFYLDITANFIGHFDVQTEELNTI